MKRKNMNFLVFLLVLFLSFMVIGIAYQLLRMPWVRRLFPNVANAIRSVGMLVVIGFAIAFVTFLTYVFLGPDPIKTIEMEIDQHDLSIGDVVIAAIGCTVVFVVFWFLIKHWFDQFSEDEHESSD